MVNGWYREKQWSDDAGNVSDQTYLQIRARRSPLPVAKSFPDGLGATEMTAQPSVSVQ